MTHSLGQVYTTDMRAFITLLFFFFFFLYNIHGANCSNQHTYLSLPGTHQKTYTRLGDINIGAIAVVTNTSPTNFAEECRQTTRSSTFTTDTSEAVAFAVDLVNRNPDILPNVTLGFVVRGTCYSLGPTLATSLSFIPRAEQPCNNTASSDNSSSDSNGMNHDVIGVLAPGRSSFTEAISPLYAVAHLPIIGAVETSDVLSDKKLHPFFFRIVPPETYQVRAILRFISDNQWSYISVLYEDCSYNPIAAYDFMQKNADRYGICVATSHRLTCSVDYDKVVSDLLKNVRARVVVLFTSSGVYKKVVQTIAKYNATKHFILIGPGYNSNDLFGPANDPVIGTFTFSVYHSSVPSFYDYIKKQSVATTRNPWLKDVWEWLLDCSYDEGTCDLQANILQSEKYHTLSKGLGLRIDAVLTLAQAAHNLISNRCPDARGEAARACITGDLLREYLKNTTFDGYVGPIKFDEYQDVKGSYILSQLVYDYQTYFSYGNKTQRGVKRIVKRRVGLYNSSTDRITYSNATTISWSHLEALDRIVPWREVFPPIEVPESVCSRPCLKGEYKIEKELSCCWDCRRCRENEYLDNGNTSCEACPSFTWPDPKTGFTSCVDIPLSYSSFQDTIPMVLVVLASILLLATFVVFVFYVIYREEKVIKASSRELSILQLFAIMFGYTTAILFQAPPGKFICQVIFFLSTLSFVLLYAPLLIKTIRIFRIFRGGANNQRPRYISPQSQIIFSACLIFIQVAMCFVVHFLYSPGPRRLQPIWTQKLVELFCDLTLPGLTFFMGYNIVLVSLCSVFAFMTRSLPDNFNESKFISMCVFTKLLIWLAFIPTYFTANRAFIQVFLLSVALLLNHSVALLFLFVPKIYAAIFLLPTQGERTYQRTISVRSD